METKICTKCKEEKLLDQFYKDKQKKDGLTSNCSLCKSLYTLKNKNKRKEYNLLNKERDKNYNKIYDILNKDNKKQYYKNNKEKISKNHRKYDRIRYNNDPLFKITKNIRNLIIYSFKSKKPFQTNKILGCTFKEFLVYLESKFEFWMTWENKGLYNGELNYGWDLDHIIPISSAKTEEELIKLNHYTNFQPLCSKINRDIKRNRLDYE